MATSAINIQNVSVTSLQNLKLAAGTKVVAAQGSWVTLFTSAQVNSILGVSNSGAENTVVLTSNGDENTYGSGKINCGYYSGNWNCQLVPSITTNIRINYLIIYWG